jgi:hypothetical protein
MKTSCPGTAAAEDEGSMAMPVATVVPTGTSRMLACTMVVALLLLLLLALALALALAWVMVAPGRSISMADCERSACENARHEQDSGASADNRHAAAGCRAHPGPHGGTRAAARAGG